MATPNTQRQYDMVFLVVPEKDEAGAQGVVEEFRKLLVDHGATIEKDETMGRRRLAYTIKKKNEATYHNFLFRGSSACVAEVQRKLRLSEDILRYLTVRIDEEVKHGLKVARNTKPRRPRPEMSDAPMAAPAAPAPSAAPEAAEGRE
ncbi:MAG TPA: 30S ribosomal protein S6 [Thermoanaerobaculia bacterium]|nr:30S ribosomal protein S6 [Thermoanaerobaculia bacterium]